MAKYLSTFLLIAGVLGYLLVPPAAAQEATMSAQPRQSALGVSPAIVELVLDPGQRSETTVSVFNVTNFPLPIKGSAASFTAKEDIPPGARNVFDASAWIELEPADFILQPRERKEVTISLTPPEGAEPGGHYATIYFQPLIPMEVLSPQTAYLTARVGVLAFLIVRGDIVEEASLGGIQTAKFRQFGPVEFVLPFKNEGNVHLLPSGEIVIADFRGREVEKLTISPVIVLPETTRELVVPWPKKYLWGKFTARTEVRYGSGPESLAGDPVEFWVVPWLPLVILLGLLTFLIIFYILARKRMGLALKVLLGRAEVRARSKKDKRRFKRRGRRL